MFFILPGTAVAAFFSRDDIDFSAPGLVNEVIDSLTPEQTAGLQFVEDTVNGLHAAMTGRTAEQLKAAEVLYILALSEQAKEPGFVAKLAGCFADSQTDEQLIAEVNAVFGTGLDPEDFSAIMNNTFREGSGFIHFPSGKYANHQLVEAAKAQLGNVGGEPYWSWYGFQGRVECVPVLSVACARVEQAQLYECGYIDKGIIPKFAGCDTGVAWFKNKNQWLDGRSTPESGMIIFFDWPDENGV